MPWMEENMTVESLVFSMQGTTGLIMIGEEGVEEGEEVEEEVTGTGGGRGVVAGLVEGETGHAVVGEEMIEEIEVETEGAIEVPPEKNTVGGGAIARIDLTDQEIENFVENLEHCKSYQMCCILNRSCYFVVTLIFKKKLQLFVI